MPAFKLCMKIIWKNKSSLILYTVIFLVVAILLSTIATKEPATGSYVGARTDVAFFSEEDTPLVAGLKQELSKSANFVELADNPSALQDALYFRSVTYIIHVPKGFTEQFMAGKKSVIGRSTVPDSVYSTMIDMKLNRYLNTAALYVECEPNITQEQLVARLKQDMEKTASVTLSSASADTGDGEQSFLSWYFNYLAYVLPAVLIFGISALLEVCNKRDLRARSFCSPIAPRRYNTQLLLAIASFSIASWVILILPCMFFDPTHFFSASTPYHILNSFAFLLTAVGISYLVGNLINGKQAISALANVFSLGPCFISGVFIQQKYLSDSVLKIASFTPAYWFVEANETVGNATNLSREVLLPVFGDIFVELVFAVALFAVGLVVGKSRRANT
jgi:ABC-2 type transport system permease protein